MPPPQVPSPPPERVDQCCPSAPLLKSYKLQWVLPSVSSTWGYTNQGTSAALDTSSPLNSSSLHPSFGGSLSLPKLHTVLKMSTHHCSEEQDSHFCWSAGDAVLDASQVMAGLPGCPGSLLTHVLLGESGSPVLHPPVCIYRHLTNLITPVLWRSITINRPISCMLEETRKELKSLSCKHRST